MENIVFNENSGLGEENNWHLDDGADIQIQVYENCASPLILPHPISAEPVKGL